MSLKILLSCVSTHVTCHLFHRESLWLLISVESVKFGASEAHERKIWLDHRKPVRPPAFLNQWVTVSSIQTVVIQNGRCTSRSVTSWFRVSDGTILPRCRGEGEDALASRYTLTLIPATGERVKLSQCCFCRKSPSKQWSERAIFCDIVTDPSGFPKQLNVSL